MAVLSGFVAAIDKRVNVLKIHRPYHESDHVLNIAFNSMCGGQTLDEPGGLSIAGQDVYIADTNNHRIRILDLKSGELSDFTLNDPRDLL